MATGILSKCIFLSGGCLKRVLSACHCMPSDSFHVLASYFIININKNQANKGLGCVKIANNECISTAYQIGRKRIFNKYCKQQKGLLVCTSKMSLV